MGKVACWAAASRFAKPECDRTQGTIIMDTTGLASLDWVIVAVYLVFVVALGFYFVRRGSRSMEDFFVSGHGLPWFLAGTSIAATSFSADAPLWFTDLIRTHGIKGAWYNWGGIWGIVIGMFLTYRLMRRTRLITDVQMAELRYGGKPGHILRVYMGVCTVVLFNVITLGWVLVAAGSWGDAFLGIDKRTAIITAAALATSYAIFSGLWGVVVTDLVQFIVATLGSIVLAFMAVRHVGGLGEMTAQLRTLTEWEGHDLSLLPRVTKNFGLSLVLTWLGVHWILSAHPIVFATQRVLACRTDKDASWAQGFLTVISNVLNGWPWLLVALCSMIVFPNLANNQDAFPKMATTILPIGLRGLMIAAIISAFMSTVDTMLTWGASYMVNDVYRPYLKKGASERHYVWVSRACMLALVFVGIGLAFQFERILTQFQFVGLILYSFVPVLVARWLWWRVNAWAEIVAVTVAAATAIIVYRIPDLAGPEQHGVRVLICLPLTVVSWVTVTLLTRPADIEILKKFYQRVHPPGFWGPVRRVLGEGHKRPKEWKSWTEVASTCVAAIVMLYASVLAPGLVVLGRWPEAIIYTALAVGAIYYVWKKLGQLEERQRALFPQEESAPGNTKPA